MKVLAVKVDEDTYYKVLSLGMASDVLRCAISDYLIKSIDNDGIPFVNFEKIVKKDYDIQLIHSLLDSFSFIPSADSNKNKDKESIL